MGRRRVQCSSASVLWFPPLRWLADMGVHVAHSPPIGPGNAPVTAVCWAGLGTGFPLSMRLPFLSLLQQNVTSLLLHAWHCAALLLAPVCIQCWPEKLVVCRTHWMICVLFSCKVQWSHLASLKNNVSPVSRSHSFSDPSPPKFAHHHLRSQDPCPPSRSEVLSQSSDSKSEVPDPTQKAWSRSDSDEVPPRVRSRKTDVCCFFFFIVKLNYLLWLWVWWLHQI